MNSPFAPPSTSEPRKYLFIDGNYLQRTIEIFSKRIQENFTTVPIDYGAMRRGFQRIIYYDSLPAKKKNQNQSDFEVAFNNKQEFLNQIRLQPKFHVRDGYTRVRPRADSGIEQKGVDTWLAIEVMQFAFKGNLDVAEIITGDLDLYPLFEALVQTNTTGVLHYHKGHTSQELIMSADIAYPITTEKIINWSTQDFRKQYLPDTNSSIRLDTTDPFPDTYPTKYGDCLVRHENNIWQATFTSVSNVLTAKSRLLLIDTINSFTNSDSVPDTAFL